MMSLPLNTVTDLIRLRCDRMKRVSKLTYSVFILLALLVLGTSAAFAQSQCYPVPNASFEQFDIRKPLNWSVSSWGGSQADYLPSTPGLNSARAGQIVMQPYVAGTDAKMRSDNIHVPANQQITIGLFAKGNASTVELQVVQYDNNNQVIANTWLGSVPLGANAAQWQEHTKPFFSAANTSHVQLEVLVKSAGSLYIDDIWAGSGAGSNTCSNQSITTEAIIASSGFIFSRTDTTEYRWIAAHPFSGVGNVWISASCASRLDVPVVRGDWADLISVAPRFDSIASPCSVTTDGTNQDGTNQISLTANGYVFSRSDKDEYRWVDLTLAGVYGSRWISKECAMRLGGASVVGDWFALISNAPAFDAVRAPC